MSRFLTEGKIPVGNSEVRAVRDSPAFKEPPGGVAEIGRHIERPAHQQRILRGKAVIGICKSPVQFLAPGTHIGTVLPCQRRQLIRGHSTGIVQRLHGIHPVSQWQGLGDGMAHILILHHTDENHQPPGDQPLQRTGQGRRA